MTVSETFTAVGARTGATVSASNGTATGVSGSGSGFAGGVSLAYDAATGAYTVRDANGLSQTFNQADIQASNTVLTAFSKTAGNVSDDLVLFNPGAGNTRLALSYVSYGAWQRLTDNGATIDAAEQFFVYGIRQAAIAQALTMTLDMLDAADDGEAKGGRSRGESTGGATART